MELFFPTWGVDEVDLFATEVYDIPVHVHGSLNKLVCAEKIELMKIIHAHAEI